MVTKITVNRFKANPILIASFGSLFAVGTSSQAGTAGRVHLCAIAIDQPAIIKEVYFNQSGNGGAGTFFRLGIYASGSEATPDGGKLLYDSGDIAADAGTGAKIHTLSTPLRVAAGIYWIALETQDAVITFTRSISGTSPYSNTGGERLSGGHYTQAYGALADPCPGTTNNSGALTISGVRLTRYIYLT